MSKLESLGILQGYYAVIDVFALNRIAGRLWIKFQNTGLEKEKEIIAEALRLPFVGWVVSLSGDYDLVVVFWAENLFHFSELIKEFKSKYSTYFKTADMSFILKEHHISHRYSKGIPFNEFVTAPPKNSPLDFSDKQILKILSSNARASLIDISEKTGISDKTVRYRIAQMEKNGVILGYRVKTNNVKLGYNWFKVFLKISNFSEKDKSNLLSFLRNDSSVVFVTESFGFADLEFEILLKTNEELRSFLNKLRGLFTGISGYSTVNLFDIYQLNYFPE